MSDIGVINKEKQDSPSTITTVASADVIVTTTTLPLTSHLSPKAKRAQRELKTNLVGAEVIHLISTKCTRSSGRQIFESEESKCIKRTRLVLVYQFQWLMIR